jgi:hypothetical protein
VPVKSPWACFCSCVVFADATLRKLNQSYPFFGDSLIVSMLTRQLAMSGVQAPFSAWPSPHVCLAYMHTMMRQP